MKAILVADDANRSLVWGDAPDPSVDAESVLIRVHATAVNRADLLQRRGLYPPPAGESSVLGLEAAGTVAAKGAAVTARQVGDRVCCLLGGGGYAEYVAVHQDLALPIPPALDFEQAAALPEALYTAFVNLVLEAGLGAGERVLIHAGGSGVGTAAIQLARQLGAEVLVTVGSADKQRRCLELGAHAAIDYKQEDFAERVRALTGGQGVDVVLDCVGAAYLERHLRVLRSRGRLVVIGLMGGTSAELNLALLVGKRLRVVGSLLRSRTLEEKRAITAAFARQVWPLVASGAIRPVIDSSYPITEAEKAYDYVTANRNFGKVVLRLPA